MKWKSIEWQSCRVVPGKSLNLASMPTGIAGEKAPNKKKYREKLTDDIAEISALQNKLYAENTQSLLIILQGMDSSGKDGTIKHIMSGVNPQGVLVHSFKHPSELELEHDYLWRHTQKLPERGQITIFNRSHYENVLISKVHPEIVLAERLPGIDTVKKISQDFWEKRYKQINHFEKNIVENGTSILKIFLHLSKNEQRDRFLERILHKEKNWKFSSNDINERQFWTTYQAAYEFALSRTSSDTAPWYVIPADDKLFAHLLISRIILETLRRMNPEFPPVSKKEKDYMKRAQEQLQKET